MLESLKFVQGSIAKKDLVPELTHFMIRDGAIRGYNGMIALSSKIPMDINCNPKAEPFIAAISKCTDTATLSLTPAGKLRVASDKFKALIECVEGDKHHVEPEGEELPFDGEQLLKAFKVLVPFIGKDASRPWANGILLKGQSAFATNNVVLVEYWVGSQIPIEINIPGAAIKELLRINRAPVSVQVTKNSMTFNFSEDRWLRTQLFSTEWPDLNKVLSLEAAPKPVPPELFKSLETLKPFLNKAGQIFIKDGIVSTHDTPDEGASVEVVGMVDDGSYQLEMINLLNGVAVTADFSTYPRPCLFYGDRLRGAIIGMRPSV